MVNGIANSVYSASIQARITAFLVEAASIRWTIIICDTLWICTNCSSMNLTTEAIDIAWIWYTWIGWFIQKRSTFNKWITKRLTWAWTNWAMIYCFACSSVSTNIRAWINAFIINAWLCSRTIWTNHTLRMTPSSGWISEIARNTFTHGDIALISTNCIHWTWRWVAWIFRIWRWYVFFNKNALSECISGCA